MYYSCNKSTECQVQIYGFVFWAEEEYFAEKIVSLNKGMRVSGVLRVDHLRAYGLKIGLT